MTETSPSYKRGLIVFAAGLILQSGHMVEHFAQLYQYVVLRLPIYEAQGILFFFNLEWNHFIFNTLYFLLLFYACVTLGFFDKRNFTTTRTKVYRWIFLVGFAIAGYHVMEHSARIGQTLQTGCSPCKGFLGWYFNGIYLHFTYNLLTLTLPLIAFFGLKYHTMVRGAFKDSLSWVKKAALICIIVGILVYHLVIHLNLISYFIQQ